jgi:hypothetical protein
MSALGVPQLSHCAPGSRVASTASSVAIVGVQIAQLRPATSDAGANDRRRAAEFDHPDVSHAAASTTPRMGL